MPDLTFYKDLSLVTFTMLLTGVLIHQMLKKSIYPLHQIMVIENHPLIIFTRLLTH